MSVPATVGISVPIVMVLEDGNTSMYPQAEIYTVDSVNPLITTDLIHKSKGRYEATWIPTSVGVYSTLFIIYSDIDHLIESIVYTREIEQVFVSNNNMDSLADKLVRILGLVHENAFIDNTIYNDLGSLISARIRIFNGRSTVEAATDGGSEVTGLIATYQIDATYESECKMGTYRVKKTV